MRIHVELEWNLKKKKKFTFNYRFTLQNPKKKIISKKPIYTFFFYSHLIPYLCKKSFQLASHSTNTRLSFLVVITITFMVLTYVMKAIWSQLLNNTCSCFVSDNTWNSFQMLQKFKTIYCTFDYSETEGQELMVCSTKF